MIAFSIIIPVYNVEKYLEKCLESVINQTLKNIEIICVNDGSTDSSYKILKEYKSKYKNIKIINQENKGLSAARNAGYNESKGKYIYFLDSDDYLSDLDALNILYKECEENNLDVALFDADVVFESELLRKNYNKNYIEYFRNRDILGYNVLEGKDVYNLLIENGKYIDSVWVRVFKKSFIESLNIKFYEGLIHEDVLYSIITTIKAKRIKYINKFFYSYRIRENSIMTNPNRSLDTIKSYNIIVQELYKFFEYYIKTTNNNQLILNFISHIKSILKDAFLICDTSIQDIDVRKGIISNMKEELIDIRFDIFINKPILTYSFNLI